MGLDSRFIIASDLQSLFRDKDTGLPLRNGKIYFWEDESRTTPKDVYKLSGSPPNYSYVSLGAVINLTASGTVSDNGNNDIILYYFPYEGAPDDSDGNPELYFVQVYSEGGTVSGVLQFTREGWPNFTGDGDSTQTDFTNYVPNGQFLLHTDIPADATHTPPYVAGEIRQAITTLSQGGWTFERPGGSTAKDIVLFHPTGSYVSNPSASPKFSVNISTESPGVGDGYKDLRLKFSDVNKFASDTQAYTFAFTAETDSGDDIPISLILIKNFGSGGSSTTETPLGNLTITSSFSIIQKSFVFGNNTGQTIGDGDYIQLAIRFPLSSIFDAFLTDFILTPDAVTVESFPQTPDSQFSYQSLTAPPPAYDSSNLYLPLRLTPTGLGYDDSQIGKIFLSSIDELAIGELACDGAQYETSAYSSDGIPYARLQAKLFNSSLDNSPQYGTGLNFVTAYIGGGGLYVASNTYGTVGTVEPPTNVNVGFTMADISDAIATPGLSARGLRNGSASIYIRGLNGGTVTDAGAGTSGFTVTMIENFSSRPIIQVAGITSGATLANPGGAGKYFTFFVNNPTNDEYYIWFKITDETDPALGGTGLLLNLSASDTAADVTNKIVILVNGGYDSSIATVAASSITGGTYWTFGTNTNGYYVWYKKDGAGSDPLVAGKIGIEVDILEADDAPTVASKTLLAINKKYFAVPDFRGVFFRGYDPDDSWDSDTANRFGYQNTNLSGNTVGTFQLSINQSHRHFYDHSIVGTGTDWATGPDGTITFETETTDTSGGSESRPVNAALKPIIKY